jgi:hypothetical protein
MFTEFAVASFDVLASDDAPPLTRGGAVALADPLLAEVLGAWLGSLVTLCRELELLVSLEEIAGIARSGVGVDAVWN